MARPSTAELVKRAARAPRAVKVADPLTERAVLRFRQRFMRRAVNDADFWYEAAKSLVLFGTTTNDNPRVKLILEIISKAIPEQRTFPSAPVDESYRAPIQINVISPPGTVVERGTPAARQLAIEHGEHKRVELEAPARADP
jgi:hypothetical protein